MLTVCKIIEPRGTQVPILVSIPHVGTEIPTSIAERFPAHLSRLPSDTDWFLDRLYDFCSDLGITVVAAIYSRYVIDLNRSPENRPLYADGRRETGLVPLRTFARELLYQAGNEPNSNEISLRLQTYYEPYYAEIQRRLRRLREQHSHAIFYDAHSIQRLVPSIQPHPFPDLILGNQDQRTAAPEIISAAWMALSSGTFTASHNHPFKGGYLTRSLGRPDSGVHALQLEMSQDIYMDEAKTEYLPQRARLLQDHLRNMFTKLIAVLEHMNRVPR